MNYILYVIAGISGGILGGMGMGGGTVLIPILTIFFTLGQHSAQAINLISFIPMAIVALIIHLKNKIIKFDDVVLIVIPGVLCCILGCYLARSIGGALLGRLFGGFLICLSVVQIFMAFNQKK